MNENEYQHYHPGRSHFAWPFVTLAIVCVAFLGALAFINTFVTTKRWHPYLGVQTKKLERLHQIGSQVSVLFVGPSHIDNGVDPRVFDAGMARCGRRTFSFNAAIGDLRGPELMHYLSTMNEVPGLRPKFVFIEPLINPAPTVTRLFATRARYHFTWETVQRGIRARWEGDIPLARKLGSIGVQGLAAVINFANLGVLTDTFLPSCPACEEAERESGPLEERPSRRYDRGFAGEVQDLKQISHEGYAAWYRSNGNRRLIDEEGMTREPRALSDAEVQYLTDLLHLVRRLGARPIALFPPLSVEIGEYRALHEGLRRHFPEVLVMPYYYDGARLSELFASERAWFDHTHMSPFGAAQFARQLASDFCKLEPEGDMRTGHAVY